MVLPLHHFGVTMVTVTTSHFTTMSNRVIDRSASPRAGKKQAPVAKRGGQPEHLDTRSAEQLNADQAKPKRMSVSLPADAAQMLETLATSQGISQNEALRKAIATEAYIQKEISEGGTILVQKANNELREVVFR
jgi:hypothetical protein